MHPPYYALRANANFYHYKIRICGLQGVFLFPLIFVIFIKKKHETHTFLSTAHTIPMKKNDHLPDFSKLCPPEQNHIGLFFSQQIFFFFLCAIGGFFWEVLFMYLIDGHFAKRGFFYGPWLPIYGAGAVLFYLLFGRESSARLTGTCAPERRRLRLTSTPRGAHPHGVFLCNRIPYPIAQKKHPIRVFFLSILVGTSLELLIGWLLDTVWQLRYWDYSSYLLNYKGYICLWSAIGFGVAGVLWICLLAPIVTWLWLRLSPRFRRNLNALLILLFILDCAAALIFPNTGYNITFP